MSVNITFDLAVFKLLPGSMTPTRPLVKEQVV
jgi:hypothetical protein